VTFSFSADGTGLVTSPGIGTTLTVFHLQNVGVSSTGVVTADTKEGAKLNANLSQDNKQINGKMIFANNKGVGILALSKS